MADKKKEKHNKPSRVWIYGIIGCVILAIVAIGFLDHPFNFSSSAQASVNDSYHIEGSGHIALTPGKWQKITFESGIDFSLIHDLTLLYKDCGACNVKEIKATDNVDLGISTNNLEFFVSTLQPQNLYIESTKRSENE